MEIKKLLKHCLTSPMIVWMKFASRLNGLLKIQSDVHTVREGETNVGIVGAHKYVPMVSRNHFVKSVEVRKYVHMTSINVIVESVGVMPYVFMVSINVIVESVGVRQYVFMISINFIVEIVVAHNYVLTVNGNHFVGTVGDHKYVLTVNRNHFVGTVVDHKYALIKEIDTDAKSVEVKVYAFIAINPIVIVNAIKLRKG